MFQGIEIFLYFEIAFILILFQSITLFYTLYQTGISLLGMFKRPPKSLLSPLEMRYALFICAHNEEKVVGYAVDSLNALDYPKEWYDIYVICDNCSDHTADIVRAHGAIAMERTDPTRQGKGYGIAWMLHQLWKLELLNDKRYDAIAIFDADNLVETNLLNEVSSKLNEGHEVIQVYLDSKNPNDNWITKAYAASYWTTNRVYQLARENIGLSAQLGGTGTVMSSRILKKYGWESTSLTEDLEFTTRYVLEENKRVAWVHTAKIYDEKPLEMKVSYRQRLRWMKGHFDCATRYSTLLLKKLLRNPNLLTFDVLVYLWQPSKILLTLGSLGFSLLSQFNPLPLLIQNWVLNPWIWDATLSLYYAVYLVAFVLEKKSSKILWFFHSYLFSLTWIPIIPIAFIQRKEKTWTHTKHTRALKKEEITL
ncbi:glycosyltransferase family 2 protein [Sulfoacidibacillus thermotolerans]|uniref:glycosyltransferase family 2 protein n=1 Tax=Sulfoacidibacillus thermotolerans TaxID=1765684 RepID=UPI000D69B648|nr:glycosyltransferase family 2 protein [Sulfoacidibacillus thermotolerans]